MSISSLLLFHNSHQRCANKSSALQSREAKLSNQASIQQGAAPLPVNHRVCFSSYRDVASEDSPDELRWRRLC